MEEMEMEMEMNWWLFVERNGDGDHEVGRQDIFFRFLVLGEL